MGSFPAWSLVQGVLVSLVLPSAAAAAAMLGLICALTKSATARAVGGAAAVAAGLWAGNHFSRLLEWWPRAAAGEGEPGGVPWWDLERGWPALLPLTVLALALAAAAVLAGDGRPRLVGVLLRVAAMALAGMGLAEALPPLARAATVTVWVAGMVLNHEALVGAFERVPGRFAALLLTLPWCAAAAAVLLFAHSARFCDLATLMTASLAGAGAVAAVARVAPTAIAAGPCAFLPPLLLAGAANTFSEIPTAVFALAAFAPSALWVLRVPRLDRLPVWPRAAVAVAAVVVVCAAVVAAAAGYESLDFGD